jgi:hypothetical protein
VIAYKFLAPGRVGPFTGFVWPVGDWVDSAAVDRCRAGIHACRVRDLPLWIDDELWEIELDGDVSETARKLVAPRGRLVGRVDGWGPALLRDFGRACPARTRRRVGFLPVLSGYVFDVDRLAELGRVPLAAFAAARAAELRDGVAGYEEVRLAQASWLAERLGLERPASR